MPNDPNFGQRLKDAAHKAREALLDVGALVLFADKQEWTGEREHAIFHALLENMKVTYQTLRILQEGAEEALAKHENSLI